MAEAKASCDDRNHGIDLLRIMLMFLVTVLHLLGKGGILAASERAFGSAYKVAWLLEVGAYCAVDCFALITGYVMVRSAYKPGKIISLWLQVFCYSFGIGLAYNIFKGQFDLQQLIWYATPVLSQKYWYVTAYFGLFLLMPFLNVALKRLTREGLRLLSSFCVILFSVVTLFWEEPFGTNRGYSMLWLIVLYVLGWTMGIYWRNLSVKRWIPYSLIAASFAITYVPVAFFAQKLFVSYLSPTILCIAVCLLILFASFRPGRFLTGVARLLSPAAFGIYLIHLHPLFVMYVLKERFVPFIEWNPIVMALGVLGSALAICAFCVAIDLVRIRVFKLLGVPKLCEWIDRRLKPLYDAIEVRE